MSPIALIPFVYLAAVVQTWLSSRWELVGASPDLPALVACCWLTHSVSRRGMVVMTLVGLASGLTTGTPLGVAVGAFAVASFSMVWLHSRLHLDALPGRLCLVWLSVTGIALIEGVASRCLGQSTLGWQTLIERVVMVGLYTTALAVPVLMIAGWCGDRHAGNKLLVEV